MKEWVKMPSGWLSNKSESVLKKLKWIGSDKANGTAALMIYIVFIHQASDSKTVSRSALKSEGRFQASYDLIATVTGLSRQKISAGISILESFSLIEVDRSIKPSVYRMVEYEKKSPWAKLPKKGLYSADRSYIDLFQHFNLRNKVELYALKVYLVIVAFRSDSENYASLTYKTGSSHLRV